MIQNDDSNKNKLDFIVLKRSFRRKRVKGEKRAGVRKGGGR